MQQVASLPGLVAMFSAIRDSLLRSFLSDEVLSVSRSLLTSGCGQSGQPWLIEELPVFAPPDKLDQLQLELRRVDERLGYAGDGFGTFDLHRMLFILECFQNFKQVVAQVR
jgi:hypothetical protein